MRSHLVPAHLVIAALLATPALAQTTNARLLKQLDQHGGYNDVWGFTSTGGSEYAVLGTTNGTAIIDATDPINAVEVGFIPGAGSTWRDMDTWGNYVYSVSEGGGGLQIIDVSNPNVPLLAASWTSQFTTAHTIYIDKTTGYAYINGANTGLVIANLANPTAPTLVVKFTQSYVHDSFAQNGMAHLAHIFNGQYRILNVASLPAFSTLDVATTPGLATHNVWVSEDDTLAATSDETFGGRLALYDISNPSNVVQKSTFATGTGSIIHNTYLEGTVAHNAWYTDGYVAVDIQNASSPKFIGRYDTYAGASGGYTGCWSVYPYQPSGVVYAADTSNGLFIVEIKCFPGDLYGTGLAGSGGFTPTLSEPNGFASLGNGSYSIQAAGLNGGASGAFLLGVAAGNLPAFGGTILVDLFQANVALPFVASGAGAGTGTASLSLPVANNPGLLGLSLVVQAIAADAGAPAGVSMSEGIEISFCDPN